jgi:putative methionine-R-sulfoxide reductase with GAF domain
MVKILVVILYKELCKKGNQENNLIYNSIKKIQYLGIYLTEKHVLKTTKHLTQKLKKIHAQ